MKNKLMILLPNLGMGGTERMVSRLSNDFVKQGVEVVIVLMAQKPKFYKINEEIKIIEPDNIYNRTLLSPLSTILFIRKQIIKEKPEAVLCMGYILYGIIASLFIKVRLYISWRRSPFRVRFPRSKLLNTIYNSLHAILSFRVNGLIAQTKIAKNYYEHKYNCDIEVIPNYVDKVSEEKKSERKKYIMNVGRFIPSKNQLGLLKIFKSVSTSNSWNLYFLGDGEMKKEAQKEAKKSSKESHIHFLGDTKDVNIWYNKSAIFAFTSTSEGFPNALAEAMAAGCACISFDCIAGPSDLIDDGINGFLIPVGDYTMYKKKLEILMNNGNLRLSFGQAAMKKMKQFNPHEISKRYLDFMFKS